MFYRLGQEQQQAQAEAYHRPVGHTGIAGGKGYDQEIGTVKSVVMHVVVPVGMPGLGTDVVMMGDGGVEEDMVVPGVSVQKMLVKDSARHPHYQGEKQEGSNDRVVYLAQHIYRLILTVSTP